MKLYTLSAHGRRTAVILLIGALIIWLFALWTLGTTIANLPNDSSIGVIVPALLMLVLVVATPLVIWNIVEEWGASYQALNEGLLFRTQGVALMIPWADIQALHDRDSDSDEPSNDLLLRTDPASQIQNPILRMLHTQAHGRARLQIYAGVEARDALLAAIREHAALSDEPAADAQPATGVAPKQ